MSNRFGFNKDFFFGFYSRGGANQIREPLLGPTLVDGVVITAGANTFQLSNEPRLGMLQIYADGLLMKEGLGKDFTRNGLNIVFSVAPELGVSLEALYIKV